MIRRCALLLALAPCACGSGDGESDGESGGTHWPVALDIADHEDPLTDEAGDLMFYFDVTEADASYELDRLTLFVEQGAGSFGVRIVLDEDDGVLELGDSGHAVEEGSRFGVEHVGRQLEVRLVADWADPDADARDLFRGPWSAM